jgi:MFS family permease
VALIAMILMGMGVVGLQVAFTSYLQRETVDAFRGRVMSLVSIVASIAAILGLTATGPFVYVLGVRAAFVVAGGVICLSSIPVVALLRLPSVEGVPGSVTPPA